MNELAGQQSEFVVYILFSEQHNMIYTGFTGNLIERYKSHNYLGTKSWTTRYRPWKVIFVEFYSTKAEAMQRESVLKMSKLRMIIRKKIDDEYSIRGFISV